jgi:integrase
LETEQGRLSMGRKPLRPNAIPRLRARRQKSGAVFYYYDHGGTPRREEPLGSDYGLAVKRWAEIEHAGDQKPAAVITFEYVANKYLAAVVPKKAPRTQKDNLAELAKLKEFFCDPPGPLDKIEPQHVQQFLRWRNTDAPIRATREKALLSHLWNWARSQGYTARPNPCAGIKGTKGKGRDVYVSDEEFAALREKADQPLRDAMDLAYLTGQRVSDTLKMDATHVRDGHLEVLQGKTGRKLRLSIEGEFAVVIERIMARKRAMAVCCTRLVMSERGQPLRIGAIQKRFCAARAAAKLPHIQFRDLRAKAGTDKADSSGDIRRAQQQLGHASVVMTETYVRQRRGAKVTPTK